MVSVGCRIRFAVLLALAGIALPSHLFAQSVLNIPRVVSTTDLFTGIAIGNPASTEVTATFTAYQPDGTPLGIAGNPVTLTIPAAGQIARNFGDLFGTKAAFNGWVQVTSAASGLTGFFLNSNYALTDFDGSGVADPSAEFTLPLAASDGTSITELTLVNANADSAMAILTLYGADGSVLSTMNASLPGRGLIRQTLAVLFGAQVDAANASHIRISADRPIVGYEVVANYLVTGNDVRRETASVSGQQMTSSTGYVLPEFVTGGGWLSLLGLVNGAGVSQQVTLTAYKEDGTLWDSPSNPVRILLNGNGGLRTTVRELFGFSDDALQTGWIQVTGSVGFLSSYVATGNKTTPSFALVTGTDAGAASPYQVLSQVAEGAGLFTSLTVVNPGTKSADLELYTLRPDGSVVGKSSFSLGPNQRTGGLLRELLPASLNQVGGWAFLRSSRPVVGSALFGTVNGAALSSVPPQAALANFQPPAQTTAAITGSVLTGDKGIGGVQIKLSGPVIATTATDDQGSYVFAQLPAGTYQVTASLAGAQFSPALQSVTLSLQNADGLDFQAGGLQPADVPQLQFISPASTFAGIGSFSIRVLGINFTPASAISINGQTLATVFVDQTELRAVLPSTLSAQAGRLTVAVVTPPPGGGSSASVDFTVVAVPKDPLIAGRAAAGSFPSGVAIDSTRNTALVTNQSGDNVSVVDLASLRILTEVPAGRSPAEGIAIDKVKDVAVVANPGSDNVTVIDLKTNSVAATIPVGAFPIGVAIDARKKRALVVSGQTDKVNIIDLSSLAANGSITVGSRPANIAINPKTNQAVVTNRGANTVTVIDLNTDTVLGSIAVGSYPRGVAINPDSNQAVVTNANGGTVSVIDLLTRTVIATINVGVGPTGVAIHTLTNTAIVTNSGISGGSTALPPQTTVSVISLNSRSVIATVPAGSAAFGVDVHQGNQFAVVADYGSNDITLIRIPNPRPRVDDVEPKVFPPGGGSLTVTITGAGFLPTSVVTLNGQPLPTTYVSSTELRAEISGTLLNQALQAGVVISRVSRLEDSKAVVSAATTTSALSVGVSNPGPGGGDSTNPSDGTANQLQFQNPVPVLLSMSPTSIQADSDLTLVLNGNNFNPTSVVNFGGSQFSPAGSTPTSITINIPHTQLRAGTAQVSVTNPPLGGGTSSPLAFRVDDRQNPAPLVLTVTPSSAPAGSGALTVTVQGNGFTNLTQASLAGIPGTVSGDTIRFNLGADQTQNAGTLTGVITNPPPGGGSTTFTLSILNPVPAVTGFTPASGMVGITVTLTVSGANFRRTSAITVEGTPLSTTFVSTTSLTATIPEAFMRIAGQVQIGVTNSSPGGGSAAAGPFSIVSPRPTLTAVTPSSVTIQATDLTVQLTGTGFTLNSAASINGKSIATSYNSSASLAATIPGSLLGQAGVLRLVVTNPPPGGGTSDPLTLPVLNPVPAISGVSPAKLTGDRQDAVLTVTGEKFVNGARILVGKQTLQTTFVSSTQLTAPFPPPLPLGAQTVTVVNPAPGGGPSNGFMIEITALKPAITSVTPVRAALGQTIMVVGSNFGPGSTVLLRGTAISTTVTNGTTLSVVIPTNVPTGPADLIVQNPATLSDPALTSAPFAIQIINPVAVITSLDPSTIQTLRTDPVTIHGKGFLQSSQVQVNGGNAVTAFVDEGTLTFIVPSNIVVGNANVTVLNPEPGGGTSNVAVLAVTNPTPVLTSISPSLGLAELGFTLTVHGTNFVNGAVINFGGLTVPATFINSSTLFANLAAAVPGLISVTVTNPGGLTSNPLSFTVTPRPSPPPPPPPAPTLSGISPNSGSQNANVMVTLTGTNFVTGATSITVSGTGVTVSSVSVTSSTTLTAAFSIDPAAVSGDRTVTVTTSNGTSGGVTFTVTAVSACAAFPVEFTPFSNVSYLSLPNAAGDRLVVGAMSSSFSNVPLPNQPNQQFCGLVQLASGLSVQAYVPTAAERGGDFSAFNGQFLDPATLIPIAGGLIGGRTDNLHAWRISSVAQPTLSGITPSSGVAGQMVTVTLTGTNFVPGGTVPAATGTVNDVVTSIGATTTTSMTVTVVLGAPGTRTITVTTIGGKSGSVTFTVNANVLSTAGLFSVSTFAGSAASEVSAGSTDATGTSARFHSPRGLTGDVSGNLLVADKGNDTIRKVVLNTQVVSTVAGRARSFGTTDGTGTAARFNDPEGVWSDGANVYIADTNNRTIRKMVLGTTVVTTLVTAGTFTVPVGIWGNGVNLYVTDEEDDTIRKVVIATGATSIIAGIKNHAGSDDGLLLASTFNQPQGIWGNGTNLYVADAGNNKIRMISFATGMVSTIGGDGDCGFVDGIGSNAEFCFPSGIWGDGTELFIADWSNNAIRSLQLSTSTVATVAGAGPSSSGSADGTGSAAKFSAPSGIWGDGNNLYVSENENNTIRKLSPAAPTISSITPSAIPQGGAINATIVGAGFQTGAMVNMSGAGVTGTSVTVQSTTSITVTFTATSDALIGSRAVTVITGAGSATTTLSVVAPPTVSSPPNSTFTEGATVPLVIRGTGFIPGATAVTVSGTGVIITGVNVVDSSTLNVGLILLGAPGTRMISVTSGGVVATGTTLNLTISSGGDVFDHSSHLAGSTGGAGHSDGNGSAAKFKSPGGMWSDGSGNLYIADRSSHTIRRLSVLSGTLFVSTIAGSPGVSGYGDGTGSAAKFNSPESIWGDGAGTLYVTDFGNRTVRKVVIGEGVVVSTIAGSAGTTAVTMDGTGGLGGTARFAGPSGITGDSYNLYITDSVDHVVRQIAGYTGTTPTVTTLAGSVGNKGTTDGSGTSARFNSPHGIVLEGGDLFVADTNNHTIRKIDIDCDCDGVPVSTVAGSAGISGSLDGTAGSSARFNLPYGLTTYGTSLYVGDQGNNEVRRITLINGVYVSTLAGMTTPGFSDASGAVQFNGPLGVATDGTNVYVADSNNNAIRQVSISTGATATLAGSVNVAGPTNDPTTGSSARFNSPAGLWGDGSYIYVGDTNGIRKVNKSTGATTTLATDFTNPTGIWGDGVGHLYVVDRVRNVIRRVDTATGAVTDFAGSGSAGSSDGTATSASFSNPTSIWSDGVYLYVTDTGNQTIRKINIATKQVTTLAGSAGHPGSTDGTGSSARFSSPQGIWGDASGNLYVTDANAVRKIVIASGLVSPFAGGVSASFNNPVGLWGDRQHLFVVDSQNHTIRVIDLSSAAVSKYAGNTGDSGADDDGGTGDAGNVRFNAPWGVWSDGDHLYVTDTSNNSIRVITFSRG